MLRSIIAFGLRISILLYTLSHIIVTFSEQPQLLRVLSYSDLAMIIFALLSIPTAKLRLLLLILLIGISILIFSASNPLTGLFLGVREMRNIIGLLVVIPLISWRSEEHTSELQS